eukprot:scaffold885_cov58-Attheya_sp.AAC.4
MHLPIATQSKQRTSTGMETLSDWNSSAVTDMTYIMFENDYAFNGDLPEWAWAFSNRLDVSVAAEVFQSLEKNRTTFSEQF